MPDLQKIQSSKLKRNSWGDDLTFLDKQDVTAARLERSTKNWLARLFSADSKRFSNRSPYGIILNALKEFQKLLFYQVTEAVNEKNILTAQNTTSILGIASGHGFQLSRGISATGFIELKLLSTITTEIGSNTVSVLRGARFKVKGGDAEFFADLTKERISIDVSKSRSVSIPIRQGKIVSTTYTGTGEAYQIAVIKSSAKISDESIKLTTFNTDVILNEVNSKNEMSSTGTEWLSRNGFDGQVNIYFGDGTNGFIPSEGELVTIEWVETTGSEGNIKAGDELTIVSGTQANGEDIDANEWALLTAEHDFVNGFDGDSIEDAKMVVGKASSNIVIATPLQVQAYLRNYPQFDAPEVWREPGTAVIHALLIPRIELTSRDSRVWTLPDDNFVVSSESLTNIQTSIFNDANNVLVSNISFKTYTLAKFSILVFVKLQSGWIQQNLKAEIEELCNAVIVSSWSNHVRKLRRSDIVTALVNGIAEIDSADIDFVGDSQYIDEIGDIDTGLINVISGARVLQETNQSYVIPVIRPVIYNEVQLDSGVKILIEQGANSWKEI